MEHVRQALGCLARDAPGWQHPVLSRSTPSTAVGPVSPPCAAEVLLCPLLLRLAAGSSLREQSRAERTVCLVV